jgi:hypothetical protein
MITDELRATLDERLGAVEPPVGDLPWVVDEGLRLRRRRRAAVGAAAACLALVAAAATALVLGGSPGDGDAQVTRLGRLDYDGGIRAYGDPGGDLHLGGRTFDASELTYLDTDASATRFGVVYFVGGRPRLLPESGTTRPLFTGPVDAPEDFHPTAKADSANPWVAWATLHDGTVTLTVHDLSSGEDVASREVDCSGESCRRLVVDALDDGVVFVRTPEGTATWDVASGEYADFAGPGTRVADVRGGVVLYDGPEPVDSGRWRLVRGAVDSQLTFDGRHVLGWSSTLEPTRPGDAPLVLDVGGGKGGPGFWTIDSDGSVLLAWTTDYPRFTVYDCSPDTGHCERIGRLRPTGGDPMFLGNDM